ncbi:sigma-70 family RNA polymerase sigma factor [Microbacterium sp. ARD31]|uniref:sigma-70 family RNA polymerase sigma factor n=1 Tax=Microbacterium sp. ARD31 TaxID=2962576 RepID=UPI0028811A1F|nr:sigma-70 family RNA polymerase sigma factor [Microbacterium sp. ARD31]MDT0182796.1 sigma-70 family RNA polymerase sigma factor [Microbacterium sp. ARD31]
MVHTMTRDQHPVLPAAQSSAPSSAPSSVEAERHAPVEVLIEDNLALARSMAARYRNRGIDLDDLEQVALLGLTKAAQRFDPDAGHDFLSYAVPTIRGELRRHFRDAGWMVRPPRRVQDLQARIATAQRELEAELGRSPRPSEVARQLDEGIDDVVEALSADGCFTPTSLDGTVGDGTSTLGDLLGADDRAMESAEARVVLDPVVRTLSERDRRIVRLRFFDECTQQEIAEDIGLTQAQVSRVLTRILADLRERLGEPSPA